MDSLFSPKSVAVIGASSKPNKWGNWAAEQVIASQDRRKVYFVNVRREIIYSKQSLGSIAEIPEPIDVAIITVPKTSVEHVVDELLLHGTKYLVVITTGFAETGQFELEARIVNKIKAAGSILIGPNCAGLLDNHSQFICLPVLCPERIHLPGTIGLISQSGGIITDVYLRLEEVGLNFSRAISIGNCSGVAVGELIKAFDEDPNTDVIALYLENDTLVPQQAIQNAKKPVVLMMPHHTPASIEAALRHTNSTLSGVPIQYVHNVRSFIATIQAVNSNQQGKGDRVMIVTDTGGLGVLASAEVEHNFLAMAKLLSHNNPIDLIGIPSGFSEETVQLMFTLQSSPEIDAILMILFLIEAKLPNEYQIGLELARLARLGKKPVVFVCKDLTSPGAKALLQSNMPVCRDIDLAVNMIEVLCG